MPEPLDRRDAVGLTAALLLTTIVFSNGLSGGFVHDDHKQIVRNDLIRSPRFWKQALTRDIWAFKGQRDEPWSNYWRPGHVLWLIIHFQLFGAHRPFPWHATNLLAHLGVVASAYLVSRKLGASRGIAFAIVCLFAIHPTRCESVTWIAGVHDVLAALWLLLALLCVLWAWERPAAWKWIVACGLYALAVSTKEIAVLFCAIVFVIRCTDSAPTAATARWRGAMLAAAPFAAIAVIFLVCRHIVLGHVQILLPYRPPLLTVLTTLPGIICFYLRQILFPLTLGWTYPVRLVDASNIGLWNFWTPLGVVVAAATIALRVRGRLALIGLCMFALTLLPALNIRAFAPEELVKDRFLYLPLLGFLLFAVPTADLALRRLLGKGARIVEPLLLAGAILALSIQTIRYNRVFSSDLTLWEHAVRTDPTSALNYMQYGAALLDANRIDDARAALDRALQIRPLTNAYLLRAEVSILQRRFPDAERDLRVVLERWPDNAAAYERLALVYQQQRRLQEAADVLRRAREQVPYRRAVFTDQLAVVLYQDNRPDEALRELESVREIAESDLWPGSRLVLFHLGMLYAELGRDTEGTLALQRFLELTEGSADPNIINARRIAATVARRPLPERP